MDQLTEMQADHAAGGSPFATALALFNLAASLAKNFEIGMSAVGGTLNNYYGQDTTLEIVAAGNMGA